LGIQTSPLQRYQQQPLPPISSLGSGYHGYITNNSSGCKSRCCFPLWPLGITATSLTAAAAAVFSRLSEHNEHEGMGCGGWERREEEQRGDVCDTAPPVER